MWLMRAPSIDPERKWLAFAAGYIVFSLLYVLTGRFHLRTPSPAPALPVDSLIPFVGWTVWIYHSQFLFLLTSARMVKTKAGISRTLYSMGLASALSFCVFLLYPTTLPRPLIQPEGLTAEAFNFLYSVDSTSNCVPSLHVALACLGARGMAEAGARVGALAIGWAALISVSTMTTKQHYFADVLAGVCIAAVSNALTKRWLGASGSAA